MGQFHRYLGSNSTLKRAANMHSTILELNQGHGVEAGLTASYCWEFITKHKERKDEFDIELDGGNFQIRWKSRRSWEQYWMTDPTRNERAASSSGMELHHVGLIIGLMCRS